MNDLLKFFLFSTALLMSSTPSSYSGVLDSLIKEQKNKGNQIIKKDIPSKDKKETSGVEDPFANFNQHKEHEEAKKENEAHEETQEKSSSNPLEEMRKSAKEKLDALKKEAKNRIEASKEKAQEQTQEIKKNIIEQMEKPQKPDAGKFKKKFNAPLRKPENSALKPTGKLKGRHGTSWLKKN